MAKLKFDVQQAKEFASKRYEVVALGGATVLAVICLFCGISTFFGDSSPEAKILNDAPRLEAARTGGTAEKPAGLGKAVADWKAVRSAEARILLDTSLFEPGMAGSSLRFNPKAL